MSAVSKKGPLYDPGLCRCCGASKKCRLLNQEYDWMGKKEIYSDMFMDCFGLLLSNLDGEPLERLICATCVSRLREATTFRQQVLRCEERFLQARILMHEEDADTDSKVKVKDIKLEVNAEGDDNDTGMDYGDDDPSENYSPITPVKPKKSTKLKRKSLKTRRLRKTTKAKKSKKEDSDNEKEREEMLESLAKMSERLQSLREQDTVKEPVKPTLDKDDKAMFNTGVIVENSYVCPFDNSFSDYQCAYCRELFTDPCKLREHNLTHDPTQFREVALTKKLVLIDISRIDCRLCPNRIDDLAAFKEHITLSHGKQLYGDVKDDFLKFRLTLNTLRCLECDSSFSFFHALKKHMAEHFGTCICDVCGAHYFEERMLNLHQRCHQKIDENFPCKECGKNFKSKYSRRLHIAKTHNKEASYECYKCGQYFLSYSIRYRHMIDVHGENRLFQCENCDRVYDSRKSLREHNRRLHLKIFKHQCDLCEKRFYLPSRLKEHMAVHTGERNFRCEYCGKSYPRLRGLKVHMQSHMSVEKKYKCMICNAAFTQNVNLKYHLKRQHQNLDVDEPYQ
ncbi:unnamed protein product [Chilo suppressalis]|uniref:Uncharacterized protein n=1 Tax=Chilo suppressalis TaxID=168631 RepID=A0ABN8BB17_CHISP|nr:unnamed protein product [Chilo suppressalis]